jgi:hypothetical protein
MPVSRRFSATTTAGTRMSTQTTADMSRSRVAGNSGWATRTHIRTTAGMPHIRNHSYRSTLADTHADVLCD